MEDPAIQNGAGVGEATPSTELTERLLRRVAEPLGVIDVRRPQQQYARTAGWVAQRFALLDHWRTRYLSEADAAAPGASFVFAAQRQPLAEPSPAPSSPIQLALMARQPVASQPGAGPSTSPSEQFRVRRRCVTSASSSQTEASVDARPDSAASAEGDPPTFNSSSGSGSSESVARSQPERGELRAAEISSITRQAKPPTSEITAQTPTGSPRGETGIPHYRAETPVAVAPTQLPAGVNRVEANPSSLPLRLQRKVSEATTGLARGLELTAPAIFAAHAQIRLGKSSAGQPPSSARQLGEPSSSPEGGLTSEIANSSAERTGSMGTGASLAKAESLAPFPLIQRQPAGVSRAAGTASGETVERRMAAAEIPAARGGAPELAMVWRQSAERSSSGGGLTGGITGGARSALPLAINAAGHREIQVARQTATTNTSAESGLSADTGSVPPMTLTQVTPVNEAMANEANEIDIAQLAAQVGRLLARQLTVERERRGRGRWQS